MAESSPVVEVFADIACPFTHVGLRRFVERRNELGLNEPVLRVRSWPLELVNGKPMDPAFIDEEIDIIRAEVASDLFTGFEQSAFPATSLPAFALVAAAYRQSDQLGESVSLEIRNLIFEEGVDVADPTTIDRIAQEHGLTVTDEDKGAASADYEEGKTRGVIGSPHFFASGQGFFCPALKVGRNDDDELFVLADPDSFNAFMDACFDA